MLIYLIFKPGFSIKHVKKISYFLHSLEVICRIVLDIVEFFRILKIFIIAT